MYLILNLLKQQEALNALELNIVSAWKRKIEFVCGSLTLNAWDLRAMQLVHAKDQDPISQGLTYTCQLFQTQRREIFFRILWNHCAHIRKCPKTFRKFTKTIRTFPKIFRSSSELGPRILFAKHNLFSFKNRRIFRVRTVIYAHFSIHSCFEYKITRLHITYFLGVVRYRC